MASLSSSSTHLPNHHISLLLRPNSGKWKTCYLKTRKQPSNNKPNNLHVTCCLKTESIKTNGETKLVWVWTENKQVMTCAVERGWDTFIFDPTSAELTKDWSSIALINPLYIKDGVLLDEESRRVASFFETSSPQHIDKTLLFDELESAVIRLLDWQVIPAENIVAAFQGNNKRVFAVTETASEAQMYLEALEHGLEGIVLKVNDINPVLKLKEYFDRRNEARNKLALIKATVDFVCMAGMGDRVCVDLCSLLKPGEGLLVGSFARGLFVVHSECLETNYIASRPFRVNAGSSDQSVYSILLQNAETVAFASPNGGNGSQRTAIPVTSLKVGDEVLLRVQGGARHTGIEIQEFIVEK